MTVAKGSVWQTLVKSAAAGPAARATVAEFRVPTVHSLRQPAYR